MVQLSDIKNDWSTRQTPFSDLFSPETSFLQIFWMLHVGEQISAIFGHDHPPFSVHLTPAREISVNEAMIAFRGRLVFYIRGKLQPWGIKAYILSESKTGYMYNMLIYYGRETQLLTSPALNHTTNIVLTLMNPLQNMGYDLYTDRFYTSPQLATELLSIGTTLTGTVMVNKRDLPAAVKYTRPKPKNGDVTTYRKGSMVVMQWTDKRTLVTLSTKHSNSMVSMQSR